MRKFLMITTAVYGLSLFAPAISQAQSSCKEAPSCTGMGYDKSEAECAGKKMLKCPFNTNFVSCEDGGSGDVLNLFDLVWKEAVSISLKRENLFDDMGNLYATFSYTLPVNGCLIGGSTSYGGSSYGEVFINGQKVDIPVVSSALICFKEGTLIALDDTTNWPSPMFIPAKSAKKPLSECEGGDFYYADDTCTSKRLPEIPIGVVIDKEKRLVLGWGADTLNSIWHTTNTDTSLTNYTTVETAITDMDGRGNSNTLHNAGSSTKATECIELNKANKHWFLPSAGQLNNILNKYDVIQPKLYEYYALDYDHEVSTIMTSTEYDSKYVWWLNLSSKTFENTRKSSYDKTLCVFEYGDE